MFWTVEKLHERIKEIGDYRYREQFPIDSFRIKLDEEGNIGTYPDEGGKWEIFRTGDSWVGRDMYLWLAAEVDIPVHWDGQDIVGLFDFGLSTPGNTSGFEALLFLDGSPYQGVDGRHQEVLLPKDCAGKQLSLRFRLWSGLNGYQPPAPIEHRFRQAKLGYIDAACDDLYYTGRAVLETVQVLAETQPERHSLLKVLDDAFRLIDWRRPGSNAFYESIQQANTRLSQSLQAIPAVHPVTVRCIGHTHIDVAWLWRLKHTREKAARSFSTVLRLMERYPEYVFLQTQPQLYDDLKRDYPELYKQVGERVREGRWEAGGAMWLEADCNLASGESLVRQLLYGIRFFEREFGVACKYLWLPDVFGYTWALPQILKKAGIEMFMTTKISWNQYNRMPHDTFHWRGIDGTEILTHFITTPDPSNSNNGAFYYTYNGAVTPETVQGIWNAYRDKDLNQDLLLAYGYGDGGGGVNREMLEMRRRLAAMPGLPNTVTGRADEYFSSLKQHISESDSYVHTWDGELYLELHRGTYTSQAYNKRINRKLELAYRDLEWLSVLNCIQTRDWSRYNHSELDRGWKIILRNQFHDIIPGSSIGEVYEDCRKEYEEAENIAGSARQAAESNLLAGQDGDVYTVWNTAGWARSGIIELPLTGSVQEQGVWENMQGQPLDAVLVGEGWQVQTETIPSMGFGTLRFRAVIDANSAENEQEIEFTYNDKRLETPFYIIAWNEQGQLTELYDKQEERSVLAKGTRANVLQIFEDKPKSRHEAWDIDLYYQEKMQEVSDCRAITIEELGMLRAVVRFEWRYMDSVIEQRLVVYRHQRRIDFITNIDWHEQRQLLKVAFPVEIRAVEATYDIQFGNVKRPTHWNTSWDYARFETVGHQWADLSERNYGVSLLNDCKYGYDIKDNVMRLTLIKAAIVPDPNADQGNHQFTYALLPHTGDWFEGGTVQAAWDLNAPLTVSCGQLIDNRESLLNIHSNHVMVDAVKKSEDGAAVVVRLHEFGGQSGICVISSDYAWSEWQHCDLLEQPAGTMQPIEQHDGKSTLSIHFQPYEIHTILLFI